jgi:predicted  nucleic acid-binding Zn-ribbon protein
MSHAIAANLKSSMDYVICDATNKFASGSRSNHGEITGERPLAVLVDFTIVLAGILLAGLVAATSYVAVHFKRQLRKAQEEYEKARDVVEAVVMSFNRELKLEVDRIDSVGYKLEETAIKAETGLRELDSLQRRFLPIEGKTEQMNSQFSTLTNAISNLSEANIKTLAELSTIDIGSINTKVQELEASQTDLKTTVSELRERVQKLPASMSNTSGSETQLQTGQMPVLPIRRDKAMAALTETEVAVLEFLSADGPKTAPEIKEEVGLSREHTARLMKKLYEEGYLERETGKLPFRYRVKEEMARLLKKSEPPTT